MSALPFLPDADAYHKAIGAKAPLRAYFDVRTFEENQPFIEPVLKPVRIGLYQIALRTFGHGSGAHIPEGFNASDAILFFTHPGMLHSWDISPNWQGFYTSFTPDFIGLEPTNRLVLRDFPFLFPGRAHGVRLTPADTNLFIDCFKRVIIEYNQGGDYQTDLLRTHVQLLLQYARRVFANHEAATTQQNFGPLTERFLILLEEYVDALLARHSGLRLQSAADFANTLAVTPDHLGAVLRNETGQSTQTHIHTRLVMAAKLLLKSSGFTIAEIAYQLGFEDPAYFARVFKKIAGQTPGQYRSAGQ
jgi:AraC-like DNA-binding protein